MVCAFEIACWCLSQRSCKINRKEEKAMKNKVLYSILNSSHFRNVLKNQVFFAVCAIVITANLLYLTQALDQVTNNNKQFEITQWNIKPAEFNREFIYLTFQIWEISYGNDTGVSTGATWMIYSPSGPNASICYMEEKEIRKGQNFGRQKQFQTITPAPFKSLIPSLPTPLPLHIPVPHCFSLHLSLPFCRSEGGSLHRDIMTLPSQIQKQCLISSPLLSGLNYCRRALSRQHQANITSNISFSKLWEQRARSHRDSTCRCLSLPDASCTQTLDITSLSHLLSALLDLIPRESNFVITENSRSTRQSPDFESCMGMKRSVQNKPPRGILLLRKEGGLLWASWDLFSRFSPSLSRSLSVYLEMQRHTARLWIWAPQILTLAWCWADLKSLERSAVATPANKH